MNSSAIENSDPAEKTPWYTNKKLWIAILIGSALLWVNFSVFTIASGLAGFLTDSCSGGSNAYLMWEIWLRYLWPVVMVIGAALPTYFAIKKCGWGKLILSALAGGLISVIWYFLWIPVLFITGC